MRLTQALIQNYVETVLQAVDATVPLAAPLLNEFLKEYRALVAFKYKGHVEPGYEACTAQVILEARVKANLQDIRKRRTVEPHERYGHSSFRLYPGAALLKRGKKAAHAAYERDQAIALLSAVNPTVAADADLVATLRIGGYDLDCSKGRVVATGPSPFVGLLSVIMADTPDPASQEPPELVAVLIESCVRVCFTIGEAVHRDFTFIGNDHDSADTITKPRDYVARRSRQVYVNPAHDPHVAQGGG
jgi:hypothetical protein